MNESTGTKQRRLRNDSRHVLPLSKVSPLALIVLSLNFFRVGDEWWQESPEHHVQRSHPEVSIPNDDWPASIEAQRCNQVRVQERDHQCSQAGMLRRSSACRCVVGTVRTLCDYLSDADAKNGGDHENG